MLIPLSEELSSELKKEQTRQYFKKSGFIEKLASIFDKLAEAPVKPSKPLDFVREELAAKPISKEKIKEMEHELAEAQREKKRLRGILKKLGVKNIEERLEIAAVTDADDLETSADLEALMLTDFRNEKDVEKNL